MGLAHWQALMRHPKGKGNKGKGGRQKGKGGGRKGTKWEQKVTVDVHGGGGFSAMLGACAEAADSMMGVMGKGAGGGYAGGGKSSGGGDYQGKGGGGKSSGSGASSSGSGAYQGKEKGEGGGQKGKGGGHKSAVGGVLCGGNGLPAALSELRRKFLERRSAANQEAAAELGVSESQLRDML